MSDSKRPPRPKLPPPSHLVAAVNVFKIKQVANSPMRTDNAGLQEEATPDKENEKQDERNGKRRRVEPNVSHFFQKQKSTSTADPAATLKSAPNTSTTVSTEQKNDSNMLEVPKCPSIKKKLSLSRKSSNSAQKRLPMGEREPSRLSEQQSEARTVPPDEVSGSNAPNSIKQQLQEQKPPTKPSAVSHEDPVPPLAGLANLGNTCYANSVLQAIRHCQSFNEAILSFRDTKDMLEQKNTSEITTTTTMDPPTTTSDEQHNKHNKPKEHPVESIVKKLADLFHEMNAAEQSFKLGVSKLFVRPTQLHAAIGAANEMFNNRQQHDAQEYLHFLLGSIQDSVAAASKNTTTATVDNSTNNNDNDDDDNNNNNNNCADNANVTNDITNSNTTNNNTTTTTTNTSTPFEGSLRYETRCCDCESVTVRKESFLDLTLPVFQGGKRSLSWSFRELCEVSERMQGHNKYFCESCNRFVEAERRVRLDELPRTLVLHLNRSIRGSTKVGAHVQTPMQLNLDKWKTQTQEMCSQSSTQSSILTPTTPPSTPTHAPTTPSSYRLVAMIYHSGYSALSGHYTCYVKSPLTLSSKCVRDQWAVFDDESVKVIDESIVEALLRPTSTSTPTAYILFYQQE